MITCLDSDCDALVVAIGVLALVPSLIGLGQLTVGQIALALPAWKTGGLVDLVVPVTLGSPIWLSASGPL